MLKRKFNTSDAYSFGMRNVLDYFLYFFVASVVGILVTGCFLKLTGFINNWEDITQHFGELSRFFHESMKDAGGALGHSKHSHDTYMQQWVPAQMSQFFSKLKIFQFHIDVTTLQDSLKKLVPMALVFKFVIDLLGVGYVKMALDLQDKKKVGFAHFYSYYRLVPKYFVTNLIVQLATVGCFAVVSMVLGDVSIFSALLLVPGVFVYQRLRLAKFFVVDKNQSIDKALKSSWKATADCWAQLAGLSVIEMIFNALGHLLLLTSFLLFPLCYQVESHVYRQMVK